MAGYLRRHEQRFFPFVDGGQDLDMASYCRREVEPSGRECEQLQVIALTESLGLRVAIEYLDGRCVCCSGNVESERAFMSTCYVPA